MLKLSILLAMVLVFSISGVFLYQNFQSKPASQPTPTIQVQKQPSPTTKVVSNPLTIVTTDSCEVLIKGSSDVPPLYKERLTWEKAQITEYQVPLAEGSQKMTGCLTKSSTTSLDLSDRVRDNYTSELENRKWEIESAGDMPGSGFATWEKNGKYFVLRVNPEIDPNLKTTTLFYSQ